LTSVRAKKKKLKSQETTKGQRKTANQVGKKKAAAKQVLGVPEQKQRRCPVTAPLGGDDCKEKSSHSAKRVGHQKAARAVEKKERRKETAGPLEMGEEVPQEKKGERPQKERSEPSEKQKG